MIKASTVSVGDEILSGRTVDTNAAHLSSKLLLTGMSIVNSYVLYHLLFIDNFIYKGTK
jgi:molybdopterin-biosynthesis enzyme MoeA-like protein